MKRLLGLAGRAWPIGLLAAGALAAVAASAQGRRRWARSTQALQDRLAAGRIAGPAGAPGEPPGPPPPTHYTERELEGLPAPVQRYFRAVLQDGQPMITAATIDCEGRFKLSAKGTRWKPFTSRQRVSLQRPGFVWDADIALAPGLHLRVVDSFIAGEGLLRASVQGLFTLAELRGRGEIARGEWMRWFAEAPWYPTALLPSQGVRWTAVDAHSAQATVVDGPLSLSLLFRFDDAGPIRSFRAEARGRTVDGQMVMTPWEGRWSNEQLHDGMRLPLTGEVAWMLPAGRMPYYVGTVQALRFEYAA